MKNKTKITLCALLVVALLSAAIGISYAVYVSQQYHDNVIVSGEVRPRFSGDFLQTTPLSAYTYPRLARKHVGESVKLSMFNYPYGVSQEYSNRDIGYTITFQITSPATLDPEQTYSVKFGATEKNFALSDGKITVTFADQVLRGRSAKINTYEINVPDGTEIKVTATPNETAVYPTLYGKILVTEGGSSVDIVWSGKFIYDRTKTPADYSAFNYNISGSGAGRYVLKWNNTKLALDTSFLGDSVTEKVDGEWSYVTFDVDSANCETYDVRFFKVSADVGSWSDVESYIDTEDCYTPGA